VEQVAQDYKRMNWSLYDRNLLSLSPAQCFRAATADGTNAIFLVSEREGKNLAAEGRHIGMLDHIGGAGLGSQERGSAPKSMAPKSVAPKSMAALKSLALKREALKREALKSQGGGSQRGGSQEG